MTNPDIRMDAQTYEERAFIAENKVKRLEKENAEIRERENMPVRYYTDGMTYAVYGTSSIDYVEKLLERQKRWLEALTLADLTLSGANMNRNVVEKKVKAAIAEGGQG